MSVFVFSSSSCLNEGSQKHLFDAPFTICKDNSHFNFSHQTLNFRFQRKSRSLEKILLRLNDCGSQCKFYCLQTSFFTLLTLKHVLLKQLTRLLTLSVSVRTPSLLCHLGDLSESWSRQKSYFFLQWESSIVVSFIINNESSLFKSLVLTCLSIIIIRQ